jgi:perosamine synthetase
MTVRVEPQHVGGEVPLARPDISNLESELVAGVLASGVLALGPMGEEFEARGARLAGRRHAVACSSGTAALHMAMLAMGVAPGVEVITTPFSFVASANCILYAGGTPRFVDIEEQTLGIDPSRAEVAATPATAGIVAVDVFGKPCRLQDLEGLAADRGWWLVEDACEGIGSAVESRRLGSFGVASTFAFYPNKQITTGEGGMLLVDDDTIAEHARSLRNQGRDEDGTWLRHVRLGFNYRLDELSAALGVGQLRRFDELSEKRARVATWYEHALADLDWLTLPRVEPGTSVNWFVYVVRMAAGVARDDVMSELSQMGIQTKPYFVPLHAQPYYREHFGFRAGDFPVTERIASETLALPFSTVMTESDVAYVANGLARCRPARRQ